MRKLATGRLVGLLLAIIGVGLSIWCACEAVRMNAKFYQWIDARPMETAIDLSQPGEITVPFHQTCSISHGEALYLECDLDEESQQKPEKLLKDLSGNIAIKDSDGKEIENAKIDGESVHYWDDKIVLTGLATFQKGDYAATIRVDSGAAALVGKRQAIYVKYHLCGLEQKPALIVGLFAFGVGITGLVVAKRVWPGLRRSGIWRDSVTLDGECD